MSNSRGRIAQLDGIRAVAIITVFTHHLFHIRLLWMGVDLFFVLSGFLITGILLDEKEQAFGSYIGGFYRRRAVRILPPYIASLIIISVADGVAWMRHWYLYLGAMNLLEPLGIKDAAHLPIWSLGVEEQFYVLWPLAVFFLNRKRLIWCSSCLLIAAPLLRGLCAPLFATSFPIYMLTPFRMDILAAGALLALMWPRLRSAIQDSVTHRKLMLSGIVCVIGSFAALAAMNKLGIRVSTNTRFSNVAIYEVTLLISVGIMVLALAGFAYRPLTFRPLRWVGMISYSIYLVHPLAIRLAHQSLVLSVTYSVAYATIMWYCVEKPLLRLGRPKQVEFTPAATEELKPSTISV